MDYFSSDFDVDYLVIDIETVPLIDYKTYERLEEEDKLRLINPIDSKLIALGILERTKKYIYLEKDSSEEEMLKNFWKFIEDRLDSNNNLLVVGFNILQFDLPFLITRSFIKNVKVVKLSSKSICDIKERLSFTRKGNVRGKLKELANLIGIETLNIDGKDIIKFYQENDWETISRYLENDLEITEKLFLRLVETNIYYLKI
ncbi:MAG: ribonuclease H-like domain-containing protein [Candidatus Anstonellales archaeon]